MKKLILFVFVILLVGTVSAAEWDNVKNYNEETKTIEIRNSILGIPFLQLGKVAEIRLNTPTDYLVPRGYQMVAQFEVTSYNDYSNAFKELELFDKKDNDKRFLRDYDFKYKTIIQTPNYVNVCDQVFAKNGSLTNVCVEEQQGFKNEVVWNDLTSSNFKENDKLTIGIFTEVLPGDHIEWIPNFFGIRIDEWAVWIEDLNVGLVSYYKLDEPSGTIAEDSLDLNDGTTVGALVNQTGKIERAYYFDGTSDHIDLSNSSAFNPSSISVGFWANVTESIDDAFKVFIDKSNDEAKSWLVRQYKKAIHCNINRGGTGSGDQAITGNVIIDNTWGFYVCTYDGTNIRGYWNGVSVVNETYGVALSPSIHSVGIGEQIGTGFGDYEGVMDEVFIYNRTLSVSEIQQLYNEGSGISYIKKIIPIITLIAPEDTSNFSANNVTFNVTVTDNVEVSEVKLFIDGAVNDTNTSLVNGTYIYNLDFADGDYNWSVGATDDETTAANSSVRTFSIDTTNPSLNITTPYGLIDFGILTVNETLNWSVTDTNIDSCWFNYNSTNTTVTCADNTTTFALTSQKNLTFYANDTFGHLVSNFTIWDYKIFQDSIIHNNESYEMKTETFSINISSNGSEIMLGSLVYNGTSYLATKTGTNYIMEFNRTITLNQSGNVSFYWSFNYGGEIINSSLFYQSVSEILMGICDGSLTTQTLNFSAWNEEDLSRLTSYDFFGTFEYWTGDGSITKSFSISNSSINETVICININETFYSDAKIQYEKDGFVKRSHYLINEPLTNSSQDKELFLLNTSSSTSFIIEVTDGAQLPIKDVYVHIQRYYPGTNQHKTVEMALSDVTGSTLGHFEAETEDYRVIFEKDGIIIFQSGTQKIFCRETPCTLTFQTVAGVGTTWEEFGVIDLFSWTLDYDKTTKIWTLIYTDTSGSIGSGRLYVYYEEPHTGKITICNTSSSQLADTLTCDVTGYNGTIYAAAYLSRSPEILVYLKSIIVEGLKLIFGLEGLVLSMFILLLLGLAGLWNPAVGIILIIVGMVTLNLIGLASFGAVTISGVIFIALLILWKLKT